MARILTYFAVLQWISFEICYGNDVYAKTLHFTSIKDLEEKLLSDPELAAYFAQHVIQNMQSNGVAEVETVITVHAQNEVPTPANVATTQSTTPLGRPHSFKVLSQLPVPSWSILQSELKTIWQGFEGFGYTEMNECDEIEGKDYTIFNFTVYLKDDFSVQDFIEHFNNSRSKFKSNYSYGNPVPSDWKLYANASQPIFYKIFDNETQYIASKEQCKNYAGRLAARVIRAISPEVWNSTISTAHWIGLARTAKQSHSFVWSDGITVNKDENGPWNGMDQAEWGSSEPNNAKKNENCVRIIKTGKLNDDPCESDSENFKFICEAGWLPDQPSSEPFVPPMTTDMLPLS